MIDQNKRKTLKTIGVTSAGFATAITTPAVFAAVKSANSSVKGVNTATESGLTITHYDNFEGHTVLLRNSTDSAIQINEFSPGYVKTPTGGFDLNVLVKIGNFTVPAHSTQAVSITRNNLVKRNAFWKHINQSAVKASVEEVQSVKVIGQYHALNEVQVPRSYLADVALV